jgi:uncharacterized membrane protein HdeD (DUF308 family)
MRIFFHPSPQNALIRGLLTILTGILFLSLPDLTLKSVIMTIGAMILASGLFSLLFSYLGNKKRNSNSSSFQGIFNILLGVIFLISPLVIVKVFGFFFGVIFLLLGTFQAFGALGTLTKSLWSWVNLIFGILLISGGFFLLVHPIESAENILTFLGAIMIAYGILQLITAWRLRKMPKQPGSGNTVDTTYEEV